jgi:SulP family sulfate permease
MIQNFIKLLKNYNLKYLRADLAAGISVAAISLPQVMAYALIAGLNPVYGIYTFVVSTIVATFTGTSNFLIVGPTNIIAVTIASTLNSLNMINSSNYLQGVLILTFLAGILQVILTSLQLGKLVNFISDSVIQGLTVAVAFIIASSQMAKLLGLSTESGSNVIESIEFMLSNINQINFYAFIIGIITLIIILIVKIKFPKLPSYMIAIIGSAFIVYVLNWQGQLELVGRFESSIPTFNLFNLNFELINNL